MCVEYYGAMGRQWVVCCMLCWILWGNGERVSGVLHVVLNTMGQWGDSEWCAACCVNTMGQWGDSEWCAACCQCLPVSCWVDKVEAAVYSVVYYVSSVEPTLIQQILLKLIVHIINDGSETVQIFQFNLDLILDTMLQVYHYMINKCIIIIITVVVVIIVIIS